MPNCAVTAAAATSDTTTIDIPGSIRGGAATFTSSPILTIVRAGDILIDRKSCRKYRNGASDRCLDPTNACLARGYCGAQSCMERPMNCLTGLFLAIAVSLAANSAPAAAQEKSITVFAAASMKNALDEIDTAYTAKTGVKITASYATSSALAKQIEQGAPADVFISADTDWMDYATAKKNINEPTRVNLLGNSIVLIAPKDSKVDHVNIGAGFDLAKLAGDGKIATGDVKSVPVGKYAKAALEKLGSWQAAEPKFAMAESVRAALTLVARGEAVLGIVYSTDAKIESGVKVVGTFPADSHPAIIYPVAATTTAKPETTDYLAFLRSTASKNILEKYGFKFLVSPTT
jgi:molybdate transport system substrate-binding protein